MPNPTPPRKKLDSVSDMRSAVASLTDSERRIRAARPDTAHVVTAFHLRSAVERLEQLPAPTPEAAANALIAFHEHCMAIGVRQ